MSENKTESVIMVERSAQLIINDIFNMKYDEHSQIDSKVISDLVGLLCSILELREKYKYIIRDEISEKKLTDPVFTNEDQELGFAGSLSLALEKPQIL